MKLPNLLGERNLLKARSRIEQTPGERNLLKARSRSEQSQRPPAQRPRRQPTPLPDGHQAGVTACGRGIYTQ